jgi:hypothetical protein
LLLNRHETSGNEIADQRSGVPLATLRFDVVFGHQCVTYRRQRSRFLQQRPKPRADIFEPVVDAIAQIEEHELIAELADKNIAGGRDNRRLRDRAWGQKITIRKRVAEEATCGAVYSCSMSGIVGLWNLDRQPLDEALLHRMSGRLRHRGPDGEGWRVIGTVGFACQHLWVTPEEVGEVQPVAGRANVMLVMDGRLDNRDELLPALGLPRTASDAACVVAAYDAWDDRFTERLNGDFAVALFDASKHRLLLARDSIGIRPLYYFRNDRVFAFASEIKALLAHPEIPTRPDDEGIADFLLVSSRPVDRQ